MTFSFSQIRGEAAERLVPPIATLKRYECLDTGFKGKFCFNGLGTTCPRKNRANPLLWNLGEGLTEERNCRLRPSRGSFSQASYSLNILDPFTGAGGLTDGSATLDRGLEASRPSRRDLTRLFDLLSGCHT